MESEKEKRWKKGLIDVVRCFNQSNIGCFIDCGTLLGAVRDGRFIPWDNDIDLGVLNNDCFRENIHLVGRRVFSLGYDVNISQDELIIFRAPDVMVNVAVYSNKGRGYVRPYIRERNSRRVLSFIRGVRNDDLKSCFGEGLIYKAKSLVVRLRPLLRAAPLGWLAGLVDEERKEVLIPEYFFENFNEIEFYGHGFLVPAMTEEYLSYRYGETWRVPNSSYDFFVDDKAIYKGF